jgi:iron complex outermembrane receptor protein
VAFQKVITNVIADQFIEVGVFPVDHPASVALGARPLSEETSVSLSAGVAFTPVDNLTFTADVFHIDIDDRVILGATFDNDATVQLLADAGITDVGGVQYFTNGLDTRTQGVDITANLRLPTGARGTLDLTGSLNYTHNEILRLDSIPEVLRETERAIGSLDPEPGLLDTVNVIAIEDERPDWRATLQANYGVGRFAALGRFSYYGGFSSAQPGFCDLCRETYGGKGLVDAEVGYQFDLVKLAVGVRNLFDTYPDQPSSLRPVDPADPEGDKVSDYNNNFGTFPWAAASPFGYNGRFAYARTEIQLSW